ncbi:nuclear transport factor 2 family protein [Nonomuraea sp. B19D2]|uniref:nuclear transport factor 2 family protein n=1 Tax=Nonomuraea sp. B19D2 TaxID=3159561 RepID=UPI0032DBA0B4
MNRFDTLDGDTAVCTASFQATHRRKADDTLWTLGGAYRSDLTRTAAGRRISGMALTAVWSDGTR